MIFADPETPPPFLRHAFKFKGLGDVFNTKALTNPVGNLKESVKTIKKSPLEGSMMIANPLIGGGARGAAVAQFITSKGKDKYDANRPLKNSLFGTYEAPPTAPGPDVPVPDAPYSMRSRAVTDSERASRANASKRKGYLSTLFAKETGGFGSGASGGASLLGG
jgi:hypothetical protein